ncbi:ketoacyl-synt-domain-containing protein [Aspergillus costaricaensis CBS 115574]|uniref:Ketoacyl-synt-domain-containing protein n=1 Tax=Aspergillus costaricaensis CBS 115574 TaxID=1448317 RepID=A0ACD1IUA2_9EURO|nr:ketoacyl-synt-domain-containing protein [Aspergillus costaricaensis CBS 115574]RAK94202.1 ketoacyl-synt-domain-containing protein [Aspergillus costaricaensis CBS 115574]
MGVSRLPSYPPTVFYHADRSRVCNLPDQERTNGFAALSGQPIAVVGMGMRLPGGVRTAKQFWDALIEKRDCSSEVPQSRYNVDGFYSADKPGAVRTRRGYFLEDDYIGNADLNFFPAIPGFEMDELDPQQTLLMEVIWECMENAGQTGWNGKDIGCYVGVFGEDWHELAAKETLSIPRVHAFANGAYTLSNRVSYQFNLKGPSATIMTACSSSLTALHEACQALNDGSCSSAIVAGTNMILTPSMTINMSDNTVLSPDGYCKTFDARANGYGRGEAVNAIYIKPLSRAIADGDNIRAVIRATSANYDGQSAKIFAPDIESQERLIRKAYQKAQIIDPSETGFFECHGTGTKIGDVVETTAIARFFGSRGMYIGSVKTNFGHGEGASGLTGVIKAILSLERRIIPPNMHFAQPNPKIPFQKGRLTVPTEPIPWPSDRKERVSVNGFGIGGANAHVILDSWPTPRDEATESVSGHPHRSRLLVVSAASERALQARCEALRAYILEKPSLISDVAHTLGACREHLPYRTYMVANGNNTTDEPCLIRNASTSRTNDIIFAFSGQGSQWCGMGRELMDAFPGFKLDCLSMDQILQELPEPPTWSIADELQTLEDPQKMEEPVFSQTLSAAVQIALVNLLESWGIYPAAVIGHSSGEVAAAYAAKAIPLRTAIIVAYYRGLCAMSCPLSGGMAVVGLGINAVKKYLKNGLVVACENGPETVNISGNRESLAAVVDQIKADDSDTFSKLLPIRVAYHSPDMKQAATVFRDLIEPYIVCNDNMIPLYSTLTGSVVNDPTQLSAGYWAANLESPVLFARAVESLLAAKKDISKTFIEVGPHSSLSAPLRQILARHTSQANKYIPTLLIDQDQARCLLQVAGELFSTGFVIDLEAINGKGHFVSCLSPYPWDRQSLNWKESRLSRNWRFRQHPRHELLGSRTLESSDIEPSWRNLLSLVDVPWLGDHCVMGETQFPCAGYIGMINEAVRQISGMQECTIRNLCIQAPLLLHQWEKMEIVTSAKPVKISDRVASASYEFSIMSYNGIEWVKHAVCQAAAGTAQLDLHLDSTHECARPVTSDYLYQELRKLGLEYGPAFRGLESIRADPLSYRATAVLRTEDTHAVHPTTIDKGLQLLSVAASKGKSMQDSRPHVPVFVDTIQIGRNRLLVKVTASMESLAVSQPKTKVTLIDNTGQGNTRILSIKGVLLVPLESSIKAESKNIPLATYGEWRPDMDLITAQDQLSGLKGLTDSQVRTIIAASTINMIQVHRLLQHTVTFSEKSKDYQGWIQAQVENILTGKLTTVEEARTWATLEDGDLLKEVEALNETLESEGLKHVSDLLKGILNSTWDVIRGFCDTESVSSLRSLAECSKMSPTSDLSAWLSLVSHSNPTLRVLEIEAREPSFTSSVLAQLKSTGGRLYSSYTVTSTSMIDDQSKSQLDDITQDPLLQGFQEGTFDLVIVSRICPDKSGLENSLQHIKRLLANNGSLLLHRLLSLAGCGKLNAQLGDCHPIDTWHNSLLQAGFTGVEAYSYDARFPYPLHYNIISRISDWNAVKRRKTIYLLCTTKRHDHPWICNVEAVLEQAGYHTERCMLGEELPPNQCVISFLDLDKPFFKDIGTQSWSWFQCLIKCSPRILWITPSVELGCNDPEFGIVLGASRTVRQEEALHFGTFQIDQFNETAIRPTLRVCEKFFEATDGQDTNDIDYEFALQNGTVYIPRFHWESLSDCLLREPDPTAPIKLDVSTYGSMNSLGWVEHELGLPGPHEVMVDVSYVGLNFRDIMIQLGIMASKDEFGVEASGIVRQCGSGVEQVKPGDKVMLLQPGLFCSRVCVPVSSCVRLPAWRSLEDTASMAVAYGTALYCLTDIARLEKGQSVLVHAACGGVGLAAINLCQMLGAEIYASVGSKEKALHLVNTFHIPRHRIFNSRDSSFLPGILRETGGRGVDIVLNSLAGELLHASWSCVAEFGKMIEIGKRDILEHGKLPMDAFGGNRAFFGVDLVRLGQKTGAFASLTSRVMDLYEEGKISPIRPLKVFEACNVKEAFRYMQSGLHIGKILIRMPRNTNGLNVARSRRQSSLSPDLAYVLVGGLGGIGQTLATWMVEKGARHLIFLSRSAGTSDRDQSFAHELEIQGCTVVLAKADVSVLEDVEAVIRSCPRPIGGILQLSMVLRDQFIQNMTHKDWQDALACKVAGTWNLHHALQGRDAHLRFFVLCGSITGVLGTPGQINYASANAFLTSFTQYRLQLGLPASVVNLGAVGDVGYIATQDPKLRERMSSGSVRLLQEQEVLDAFELAILKCQSRAALRTADGTIRSPNNIIVGMSSTKSLTDLSVRPLWGQDARFSIYRNFDEDVNGGPALSSLSNAAAMRDFLALIERQPEDLDTDGMANTILEYSIKCIQEYSKFAHDLGYDQVVELPIDSLMTIEIRNWSRRNIGVVLPLTAISKAGTIGGLGEVILASLRSKYSKT